VAYFQAQFHLFTGVEKLKEPNFGSLEYEAGALPNQLRRSMCFAWKCSSFWCSRPFLKKRAVACVAERWSVFKNNVTKTAFLH